MGGVGGSALFGEDDSWYGNPLVLSMMNRVASMAVSTVGTFMCVVVIVFNMTEIANAMSMNKSAPVKEHGKLSVPIRFFHRLPACM